MRDGGIDLTAKRVREKKIVFTIWIKLFYYPLDILSSHVRITNVKHLTNLFLGFKLVPN